ncbi:MAG: Integrase catalytic region [Gemmatimonadetes bacterium]|nr:Integrase catalytic region [Gemmatimonadota bacterium]
MWRGRPQSARAIANEQFVLIMRDVHAESDRTYGSPRMQVELAALGHPCSENRVAHLMRADGLRPKRVRRFRITTDSTHTAPIVENVLDRQFAVTTIPPPNQVWVSDITYIATREGWLYLAIVLDLRSRRVVGWAMRHTLEWELARDALAMALGQRQPAPGLVHHSDRDVQYACDGYRTALSEHAITASMSRRGNCWDNAVAESFFATLKTELVMDADWATREEARCALFRHIEMWYNRRRRHSSLGYLSPLEFERLHDYAA